MSKPISHRVTLSAALLLLLWSSWAGDAAATKFAGAFMADGGGARAMGMGSAFVAVADDASTSFWNPAGLLDLQRRQVLVMHSERFGDLIDRSFASYAQPLNEGNAAFAVSVIRLGLDDIAFTEHLGPLLEDDGLPGISNDELRRNIFRSDVQDAIEYKSDQEWALFGSYARRFGDWQLGGNVKLIRQSVGDYGSFGMGVDVGALRRSVWRNMDVGIKLQDATFTYLGWDTGTNETITPVAVPGAAYRWAFPQASLRVLAASALELHFDDRGDADQWELGGPVTADLNLGVEATFEELAQLRIGTHGGFEFEHMTFGAGLLINPLRVDYGFAGDVLNIEQNTHRISIGYEF